MNFCYLFRKNIESDALTEDVNMTCNLDTKILFLFSLQPASIAKIKWALRAYDRWIAYRKEIYDARITATFTRNNHLIKPIHNVAHDVAQLKEDVCDFKVEIHKENGEQYPGNSLYDLLQGLCICSMEKDFPRDLCLKPSGKLRTH